MKLSQTVRYVTSTLLSRAVTQGAIGAEQILRSLAAAAEIRRKIFRDRICVPDRYLVILSSRDFGELKPFLIAVHAELVEELTKRFKARGFHLNSGKLTLKIHARPEVAVGHIRVSSRFELQPSADSGCCTGLRLLIAPRTAHELKVDLAEGPHTIGRGQGADVALPAEDRRASKLHCRIDVSSDGAVLQDLGSANGTRLNDRPVAAPCPLSPGDRIVLGDTLIEVAA